MTNQTLKFRYSRKLIVILFLSLIFVCCSTAYAQEEKKSTVKITIKGIKTDDGKVKIEIFDTEENWLKKAAYEFTCEIKDNKSECVMENIPYSEYAIIAYQDKNSNDELDLIEKRIPTEPYGYSGTRTFMWPARWSETNFLISSPKMEMEIKVLEIAPSVRESLKYHGHVKQ